MADLRVHDDRSGRSRWPDLRVHNGPKFAYEDGALQYLRLLGLAQTCRFQEKSFLRFLLSGARNIDDFKMEGRRGFVWPQH